MIGGNYKKSHQSEEDRDSNDSDVEQMWYAPAALSLADVYWLYRDQGEPGIHLKAQIKPWHSSHHHRHNKRRQRNTRMWDNSHPDLPLNTSTPLSCSCSSNKIALESGYNTPSSGGTSGSSSPGSGRKTAAQNKESNSVAADPEAMEKISAMEKELFNLRQQIAVLVLAQEQTSKQIGKELNKNLHVCDKCQFSSKLFKVCYFT